MLEIFIIDSYFFRFFYIDGGISRLHVFGQVVPDWTKYDRDAAVDLAAMLNGGACVGYSNAHFGHARNVLQPLRAKSMADGWETARRVRTENYIT